MLFRWFSQQNQTKNQDIPGSWVCSKSLQAGSVHRALHTGWERLHRGDFRLWKKRLRHGQRTANCLWDAHIIFRMVINKATGAHSYIYIYDIISYHILYYIILYYYYIILYYILLYYIILYFIFYIILYYIIIYYFILYNIILYYIILQYIILYYIFSMYGFPWQGMGIRSMHHITIPCLKHCTEVTFLCLVL